MLRQQHQLAHPPDTKEKDKQQQQQRKEKLTKIVEIDSDSDSIGKSTSGASSAGDLSTDNQVLEHTTSSFSHWNESADATSSDGEQQKATTINKSMIRFHVSSSSDQDTTSSSTSSPLPPPPTTQITKPINNNNNSKNSNKNLSQALQFGLQNLRKKRSMERKKAMKTLEESKWLLELIWRASRKSDSCHTSEESGVLSSRRGGGNNSSVGRMSVNSSCSFSSYRTQPKNNNSSMGQLRSQYKVNKAGVIPSSTTPKLNRKVERVVSTDSLFGRINKMASPEPVEVTTPIPVPQDKLVVKLKIMLSKKWAKDGELLTWTPVKKR